MTITKIQTDISALEAQLAAAKEAERLEAEKAAERAAAAELKAAQEYDQEAAQERVRELWQAFVDSLTLPDYVAFWHAHEEALEGIIHARSVILADRNRLAREAELIVDRFQWTSDDQLRAKVKADFLALTGETLPDPDGRTQALAGWAVLSSEQIPEVAQQRPQRPMGAVSRADGLYLPRDYSTALEMALQQNGVR